MWYLNYYFRKIYFILLLVVPTRFRKNFHFYLRKIYFRITHDLQKRKYATQNKDTLLQGKVSFVEFIISESLLNSKLCLIDIGARGTIPGEWERSQTLLQVIGFEPDIEECQRLNDKHKYKGWVFLPYAIGDSNNTVPFYITQLPNASGVLQGNMLYLDRFDPYHSHNLEVVDVKTINTVSLSEALASYDNVSEPCFLKIDVEGSEALVLNGAKPLLEKGAVLGVKSEVWMGSIKDENELNKIDSIMLRYGLYLFDVQVQRYRRRPFHRGLLQDTQTSSEDKLNYDLKADSGQILTGDVLYLRDPVWEHMRGSNIHFDWNDNQVLKMMLVYDAYNMFDCAAELLTYYGKNFKTELPIEAILNTLMPADSA